jgi:hypothetical protein
VEVLGESDVKWPVRIGVAIEVLLREIAIRISFGLQCL